MHERKPGSLNRTFALVVAATILYIPANVLPMTVTDSLLGRQQDTIMSGVIYFWQSGTIWCRWSFYGEYFYSDAKASYFVFPVVGCIYTVIRGVEVCTGAMH